jgi:hypothetical protein
MGSRAADGSLARAAERACGAQGRRALLRGPRAIHAPHHLVREKPYRPWKANATPSRGGKRCYTVRSEVPSVFTVEHKTGKLIEVRRWGLVTAEEIDRYFARFREIAAGVEGTIVVCSDFRGVTVLPDDALERMRTIFRTDKPRVIRSGLLVAPKSQLAREVEAHLRAVNSPSRRAFEAPEALKAWLGQVLTRDESDRMAQFLVEPHRIIAH